MTLFEKIIIPLIDDNIKPGDLTCTTGFVDSYTVDPDNPSGNAELFLMYDLRVENEHTIQRARRFSVSPKLKKTYVKYIDDIPYLIYSFWVNQDVKKLYNGVIFLSAEQKARIIQFWGVFSPEAVTTLSNSVLTVVVNHEMPLEDYNDPSFNVLSITKGAPSYEDVPFYFVKYRTSAI